MAKQVVVICNGCRCKSNCKVCSAANTNIAEQTTCIDCPAGTVEQIHDNDDDPWDGGTNECIADAKLTAFV